MRKSFLGGLALLTAAMLLVPATFAGNPDITWTGGLMSRFEYLQNFTDGEDTNGVSTKDDADFFFYRANIGMLVELDDVDAYFELQNHGTWGDSLIASNPQDPIIGNLWATNLANNNDTNLYQAWFKLENVGGSNVSLKIGRQEKTLGNELHLGDGDFYSGQYHDGVNANFDMDTWDIDAFWFKPAERDILPGNLTSIGDPVLIGGSDDADLFGVTANFTLSNDDEIEPYILYHRQGDEFSGLFPRYSAYTIGGLYQRDQDHDSPFDFAIEAAMQTGEAKQNASFNICPGGDPDCDISSMIVEGHFGYSFAEDGDTRHRVRIGGLMIGDGDDDQDIESFMNLYPDTHRRAGALDLFSEVSTSLPALDALGLDSFHNLTNYYLGWDWTNGTHAIDVAFHNFTATEDIQVGPSAFEDALGTEFDVIYDYMHGEHFGMQAGVAVFSPDDVFDNDQQDTIARAWFQGKVRF